jgi:hypothetical protein
VLTERFWIYKERCLQGPYAPSELVKMQDFSASLLVCQDGDDRWLPVRYVSLFHPYLPSNVISTGDYHTPPIADKTIIEEA